MNNLFNCRICHEELEDWECYKKEDFFNEQINYMRAYCPWCEKRYKWREIFKLTKIEGFREEVE